MKKGLKSRAFRLGFAMAACQRDHQGGKRAECLQNLIENAIKYGDVRRIEISFDKMDGCELITVSNTGRTLETKELQRILRKIGAVKIPGSVL